MTRYWFISSSPNKRGAKLAFITFALAFVVVLLGAYTRLTDSGLSCPDWPHCFGLVTAPYTQAQIQDAAIKYPSLVVNVQKAWTEMRHRYFAGTEGMLIFFLACTLLFSKRYRKPKASFIAIVLLGLLGSQVILGKLTVTEGLKPTIVLSHLLTGLSILSVLWWAYLDLHLSPRLFIHRTSNKITPWCWLALFIVIGQIALGGWVSTHQAGLACIDLPYCNGKLIPTMQWHHLDTDLISIHMLHRFGAVITATYLILFSAYLYRQRSFKMMASLILALLALQVALGILNIEWLRPVWIALLHHTVAIFLLLTMITLVVKAHYQGRDNYYDGFLS
jgi:cytochrome c oxidase assembly protein subunit 15